MAPISAFTSTADKLDKTVAKREVMDFYKQQLAEGYDFEEAAKRAKMMKDAMALFLEE